MRKNLAEASLGAAYETKARLECAERRMDIRAEAFLELVTSVPLLNAFAVVAQEFAHTAWQEYTGYPVEVLRPASRETEVILDNLVERARSWIDRGYQRLAEIQGRSAKPPIERPSAGEIALAQLRLAAATGGNTDDVGF